MRRFVRRYERGLPFVVEAQPMPAAFDLRALPTTYVIDRRGRIVLKHRGAAGWNTPEMRQFPSSLARS